MSPPNYMEPVDDENNNNNGDTDNNENNNNMNGGASFGDEEFDSENQEDGSTQNPRTGKRKRYHRHTQQQIQEMENFFKECPHPDDKQRKELSRQLGLDHLQIKFWFQNKRTQNKNHQERHENSQLREENTRLIADNHRYQKEFMRALCPKCNIGRTAVSEMSLEEHRLRLQNAQLTEEIHQLSRYTVKAVMRNPVMSPPNQAPPFEPPKITNGSIRNRLVSNIGSVKEADKPLVIELAVGAMSELMALTQTSEPLWKGGVYGAILDVNEYTRNFQNGHGPRPVGFRTEASRETAIVLMHHMDIVHRLMDVNLWSTMFAGMVGRAKTHDTLLTGVHGNLDGTIHLMTAEFLVLSPLVSTRESYFVRYCKQLSEGLWGVVDISIDHLIPNLEYKCRRKPSGCLIKDMPNGFSKVTWVEHVEVDDRGELHDMFKNFLNSGQALGASRWIATLDRQCERLAIMKASNIPSMEPGGHITVTHNAKKSLLKLVERMSRGFFDGVTASTADVWCNLPDYTGDRVRVMTRKSMNDPGKPEGLILCAAHSFWVPVTPITVFDYLRDENNRSNWDVLFLAGTPQKLTHIFNGRDTRNCVSLLRSPNTRQSEMMMIEESSIEPTASFLVYAPLDVPSIEKVLNGGDPDYVPLLPSGFAILPDGMAQPGKAGGTLVNVSFQMLVDSSPSGRLTFSSVSTIESLILEAANKIRAYFTPQTP
ncbi:homeobox-leucine zipper protein HDG2 isoform X2 [Raphanus sativus]|nr:homeobox-leucine zipper protein HDG2 isoform X2 [Raphanus sativus]XP_056844828.1 homeobox-leucine zipper protein HDG2 isoform X2 [Raphanus sativus]